ncbi:hypothetical protein MAR_029711 [Mya arenaria]|uniref:BHLH domain-containing protein n=1 Tax=Mya arenaria TaxID=6604 RepID=A0ABY7DH56_MYAAR|nr:hypothetical protein MAR_029711 [Mya arenaria]
MTQATYNSNEMFSECLDPRYQFKVEVASDYDSSDYEEIDLGLKDEEKTVFDNCNQLVQCRHIRKVGKSRQKPIIISKGKKNIKKAKSNSKQKQQVDQPDELCKIVHDEFDSDVDVLTDWDGSKEFRSKMLKQWIALEHDYSGKKTINHLAKLPQHGKELCTEKRMKKMKKEQAQCGDRELRGVMHNSLERKRRHEMSNLFLELGKVVYSPIKWIMLNRPTKKGIIQRALQQIEKLKLSSLDINVQRYNLKIQIEHNRAKIKRLRETFDEANTV